MAKLEMEGPFDLENKSIDANLTKASPGNYALGKVKDEAFYPSYVGRADTNVNDRLKEWVGKKYTKFKFSYAPSPKAAFEKECRNFHDFGGTEKLDNDIHPDRPKNSDWKCPFCKNFG